MKNIKISLLAGLALCSFCLLYGSEKLNMYLDYNRFLDKNKNTILLVDYQVPYNNLAFIAKNNGYFAELQVAVKIVDGDSVLAHHEINDIIGVKNKADTGSKQKSYLNRLSFVMDKPFYTLQFVSINVVYANNTPMRFAALLYKFFFWRV